MTDTTPAAESLAVHAAFLRAFARALVRGNAEIDDVVQDAFVVALGKEPRDPRATRSWLAGILRNLVLRRRKHAEVRARHLSRLPHVAVEPSPDEIAAREEARGRVVAALLAEDELYRRPLLLRYYEGLGPREIAVRMGVPLETVRTRLRRGLARLRTSLDEGHGGDRRAWSAVLLPMLVPAPAAGAGVATKVAVAVVLLAGAGVATRTLGVDSEPGVPPAEPASVLVAASTGGPPPPDEEPAEEESVPLLEVAGAPEGRIRVLVVDDARRPLPDSEVQLRRTKGSVRTDADGIAELDWTEQALPMLIVRAPGRWWTFTKIEREARSAVIVFPSLRTVTGQVLDDRGKAVPGARVVVVSPDDLSGWSSDPKHAEPQVTYPRREDDDFLAVTTADGRGRFRIEVPAGSPQVLMAMKEMHLAERFVVQPEVDEAVLTAGRGARLTVFLRGPDGAVEEGGICMQWEDDCDCPLEVEGRNPIVLQPLFPGRWRVLGAGGGGFMTRDTIELSLARGERREIEVRLGPRPEPTVKTVRWKVRILDADGEPMDREQIRRWRGRGAEEDRVRIRWRKDAGFRGRAEIDPEGSFEVRAPEDVAPWLEIVRVPIGDPFVARLERGGGAAEIRLPIRLAEAVHRVRVRVLDPEGNPVEDAHVTLVESRADRALRGRTDAGGRVAFEGAVPPPWRIHAGKEGFGRATGKLDVLSRGEVVLRLAPPPPAEPKGRLELRILLERGDFAEADVFVSPGHTRLRINALGEGALELAPGEYRVTGSIPLADEMVLDAGTAVVRDGETTTLTLCGKPLVSARIRVEAAPPGLLEIAAHDAKGRAIVYGAYIRCDRPFRVRYPTSAAKLSLCHRDSILWITAPHGDVTVLWSDARSE